MNVPGRMPVSGNFEQCHQYLENILPCLLKPQFEFYDDTYLPLLLDAVDQLANNSTVEQRQNLDKVMDKFLTLAMNTKDLSDTAQVVAVRISKIRENTDCLLFVLSQSNLWSHITYNPASASYNDKLCFYTREHFTTITLEQEVLAYLATCFGRRMPKAIDDLSAIGVIAAMRNLTRDFSSCSLGLRRVSVDYLVIMAVHDTLGVVKAPLLIKIYEELLTSLSAHVNNDDRLHSIISIRILCGTGLFHGIEAKLNGLGIDISQIEKIEQLKDKIKVHQHSLEIKNLLKVAYQPSRSISVDGIDSSTARTRNDIIDDCSSTLSDIHLCLYPEKLDTYDSIRTIDCCE